MRWMMNQNRSRQRVIRLWVLTLLGIGVWGVGCTNVVQDRGPALRRSEEELRKIREAEEARLNPPAPKPEFVGYEGSLGKAAVFLRNQKTAGKPIPDQAIIVYFGQVFMTDDVSYESATQNLPLLPKTSLCSDSGNTARANQDRAVLGVAPGFPNCEIRAGRFVFDCSYWGYTQLSFSRSEISVSSASANLINMPRSHVSLTTLPDNFTDPTATTPAVCRAVSVPLSQKGKNQDFVLMEFSDLRGACPVIEQTQPRFSDMMVRLGDISMYNIPVTAPSPGASPTPTPGPPRPYDEFGFTWAELQQGTGGWAIPQALISPISPWAQDVSFGPALNNDFVRFYLNTGLLYPTTSFQEVDVSESGDLSVNIYSLYLPNLKLFHPNSGQFDSQNKWDPRWDALIITPEEHLPMNPRHWINNLSDAQLELCADVFTRTEFLNPDVRRVEPSPTPSPGEEEGENAGETSGNSAKAKDSPKTDSDGNPLEEIPPEDRWSN